MVLVGAWLVGLVMGAATAVIVAAIVSPPNEADPATHTLDATASADVAGKE